MRAQVRDAHLEEKYTELGDKPALVLVALVDLRDRTPALGLECAGRE